MELIAQLIELALWQCYELGVIDWPENKFLSELEDIQGECVIELNRYYVGPADHGYWNGDWFVCLLGVFVIIDAEWLEVWHASKLADDFVEV